MGLYGGYCAFRIGFMQAGHTPDRRIVVAKQVKSRDWLSVKCKGLYEERSVGQVTPSYKERKAKHLLLYVQIGNLPRANKML